MTLIDRCRRGEVDPIVKEAAAKENMSAGDLARRVAEGKAVIPRNRARSFKAEAIGEGLRVKINANIGTSSLDSSLKNEIEKLHCAVRYGAHSVMDLSTGADHREVLARVLEESPVMIGTVPLYAAASGGAKFDRDSLFRQIEAQAKAGVDFMTLHCGLTKSALEQYDPSQRVTGIVSRGGALLARYMKTNGCENPLYEEFDWLLDIARTYEITLSLGDGLRPGAGADSLDTLQLSELCILGSLVRRAREAGVQVMVEGPGHVPMNEIGAQIALQKKICDGAPFYVLGPLVTDSVPGYDHIAAAIGGAIAAWHGADFLCYVTPAEHLTLPDLEDVREGVIASVIAARAAEVARGYPAAISRDRRISEARKAFDWETIFSLACDPDGARAKRKKTDSAQMCTMCGELCAMRH